MNSAVRIGVLLALVTMSMPALGDHICTNSPNEVPIGMTQGGQGQAPVPICRWVQSNDVPQQQAARTIVKRGVWEDRWGAIVDDGNGRLAVSVDRRSKAEAERAATEECVAGGGEVRRCRRVKVSYRNQCMAYAWGGGHGVYEGNVSLEQAEQTALRLCGERSGAVCEIMYSDCSEAVFLGYE